MQDGNAKDSTSGQSSKRKIIDLEELKELRSNFPNSVITHCHGVFDVMHAGHLSYFESAKKFGDLLVVTLTADEFVNKGPGRPYFPMATRARMLASLEIIDFVAISFYPTAVNAINLLKPHFYVKGPDYRDKSKDVTGGILIEEKTVRKNGGKLVFTADATHSSSSLINKFLDPWSPDQASTIELVKKAGGIKVLEQVLESLMQETVLLVGEPIVDRYTFCLPESISSKSPTISAKYLYEESYAGGSLAIANHLADFVKQVTLLTTHGNEGWFMDLISQKLNKKVHFDGLPLTSVPTPRKTRFISTDRNQRFFEITDLRSDQWKEHSSADFCAKMEKHAQKHSTMLFADFGHGLFEAEVLERASHLEGFIGLNVQTNSSNIGFNLFTKHKRYNYLSIDAKEAKLGCHDRNTAPLELARRIQAQFAQGDIALSMTLGGDGSFFIPKNSSSGILSPAFADNVVDAIGAGDAFFALTSLLVRVGCPEIMIPFIGNVFAGLKTKILGNQSSVSKAQLLKALNSMLS